MSIRSFLDRRAQRRYRRAFLARGWRNSYVVAAHLRDALPFLDQGQLVAASGVYPCSTLLQSSTDPVRRAVADLGGVEFWVEDGLVIHSVYVITEARAAYNQRNELKA